MNKSLLVEIKNLLDYLNDRIEIGYKVETTLMIRRFLNRIRIEYFNNDYFDED